MIDSTPRRMGLCFRVQWRNHGGGGGAGGPDPPPPFGPLCRLFNIGPKIRPTPEPPFLLADLRWTPPPLLKILDPPLGSHTTWVPALNSSADR